MLNRERIIEELESRMYQVDGVGVVFRNPSADPNVDDLATGYIVTIIELEDHVELTKHRGIVPIHSRNFRAVVEVFVSGSSDGAVSKELMAAVENVKTSLYSNSETWRTLRAVIKELGYGRVLRPPLGNHVAGIGMELEIKYVEDNTTLPLT